mgnify:CR=1 FL=1
MAKTITRKRETLSETRAQWERLVDECASFDLDGMNDD